VFGERTYMTRGVGAVIAAATNEARYPQLLAGTTFWQRLYRVAEERYRVE